jgi:hypothetical protein
MYFAFFLTQTKQLEDKKRIFNLSPQDIALMNPNTFTCPTFRTNPDAEITKKIYQNIPILEDEITGINPWEISFMTMFHMANDSNLFKGKKAEELLPLYEAKMFFSYDHRFGYYTQEMVERDQNSFKAIPCPTIEQKQNPNFIVNSRYWVSKIDVENKVNEKWNKQWLLAWRDITSPTNEYCNIFSFLPKLAVGHTAPILLSKHKNNKLIACLGGNLNSLIFDFITRQKIGGIHLTFTVFRQLPVIPPESYTPQDIEFISKRVLELTYTAYDLKPFAEDMGYHGEPFIWDENRRAILRAELDAKYAKLYGLTREELRYILDPADIYGPDFPSETFRVLKNNEIKKYGEYRTQKLVLAAWDMMGY